LATKIDRIEDLRLKIEDLRSPKGDDFFGCFFAGEGDNLAEYFKEATTGTGERFFYIILMADYLK